MRGGCYVPMEKWLLFCQNWRITLDDGGQERATLTAVMERVCPRIPQCLSAIFFFLDMTRIELQVCVLFIHGTYLHSAGNSTLLHSVVLNKQTLMGLFWAREECFIYLGFSLWLSSSSNPEIAVTHVSLADLWFYRFISAEVFHSCCPIAKLIRLYPASQTLPSGTPVLLRCLQQTFFGVAVWDLVNVMMISGCDKICISVLVSFDSCAYVNIMQSVNHPPGETHRW